MKKKFAMTSRIMLHSALFVIGITVQNSFAAVTGPCANCHTMHNSQNGDAVATTGGWNGSGGMDGSTVAEPQGRLLKTSCVGCHSSTTSDTIVNISGSTIPIVFNTVPPSTPLAGGNFYWVSQGDDTKGHNVYGVAGPDTTITSNTAPGRNLAAMCYNSCHDTLAAAPSPDNFNRGGCQGCHVFTAHHNDSRPWYRFLKGHDGVSISGILPTAVDAPDYVLKTTSAPSGAPGGYVSNEDPDWEFTKSASDHNYYKGSTVAYNSDGTGLTNQKTISSFCAGCHAIFHNTANINAGSYTSPWLRHPTDIQLPTVNEYAGYDPVNYYSPEAPVAWVNPTSPVRAGAVVMCLSCHRPHGSDQPDMLRWNYGDMVAGNGTTGNVGCFTCHTTKDNVL